MLKDLVTHPSFMSVWCRVYRLLQFSGIPVTPYVTKQFLTAIEPSIRVSIEPRQDLLLLSEAAFVEMIEESVYEFRHVHDAVVSHEADIAAALANVRLPRAQRTVAHCTDTGQRLEIAFIEVFQRMQHKGSTCSQPNDVLKTRVIPPQGGGQRVERGKVAQAPSTVSELAASPTYDAVLRHVEENMSSETVRTVSKLSRCTELALSIQRDKDYDGAVAAINAGLFTKDHLDALRQQRPSTTAVDRLFPHRRKPQQVIEKSVQALVGSSVQISDIKCGTELTESSSLFWLKTRPYQPFQPPQRNPRSTTAVEDAVEELRRFFSNDSLGRNVEPNPMQFQNSHQVSKQEPSSGDLPLDKQRTGSTISMRSPSLFKAYQPICSECSPYPYPHRQQTRPVTRSMTGHRKSQQTRSCKTVVKLQKLISQAQEVTTRRFS